MQAKDLREAIIEVLQSMDRKAMTAEEIIEALPRQDFPAEKFWQELMKLEERGEVLKARTGAYGLPENMGFVAGRFQLTSKGFGFVIPDNKKEQVKNAEDKLVTREKPDVFIPPHCVRAAMNNDRVLARITQPGLGRKPEGEIVKVVEHANNKVVGIFHYSGDFAFATPDDKHVGQDVYVARKDFNGAKPEQKVVVEITLWPKDGRKAEGRIVEVLVVLCS